MSTPFYPYYPSLDECVAFVKSELVRLTEKEGHAGYNISHADIEKVCSHVLSYPCWSSPKYECVSQVLEVLLP